MQKREYREWVRTVYENVLSKPGKTLDETVEEIAKTRLQTEPNESSMEYHVVHEDSFQMEESFTIHLGEIDIESVYVNHSSSKSKRLDVFDATFIHHLLSLYSLK